MKKLSFLFLLVLTISCSKGTIKKPKKFIEKDKMIALIIDMKIAEKARTITNKDKKKNINYMATVFNKYKIDSTQFKENNDYYTEKLEVYQEIYKAVHTRLQDSVKKYKAIKKINDSLKKEKKKKLKLDKEKNIKALKKKTKRPRMRDVAK